MVDERMVIRGEKRTGKSIYRILSLFVILLFLNLPVAFAVNIGGTSSSVTGSDSAVVSWTTDEEADSLVSYGTSADNLDLSVSSSDAVLDHSLEISGLDPSTEYFFSVASSNVDGEDLDDNEGAYYSFTTFDASDSETESSADTSTDSSEGDDSSSSSGSDAGEPVDTSASISLTVDEFLSFVPDDSLSVSGSAAEGTEVRVYVNGGYFAKDISDGGFWSLSNVPLTRNAENEILFEASLGSQTEEARVRVVSDLDHPELVLEQVPSIVSEKSVTLSGQVSELSEIVVTVNDVETKQGIESVSGPFSLDISLEEGDNSIVVRAIDRSGLASEATVKIGSDTKDPEVDIEFSKGQEYYQNRAETDITGTTEPGSTVFLYVYRPLTYDDTPDFSKGDVWDVVRAGEEGKFQFSDVDFENEPVISTLGGDSTKESLLEFAPKKVPAGLEQETIKGITSAQAADTFTYHVYVIAVDKSGKKGYAKEQITVNSCYSQNLDFLIKDEAKFQAPLKLDPQLLDDGREQISAVFQFEYQGDSRAKSDLSTGVAEQSAFNIESFSFQKACTQSMLDDEKFEIGCTILPNEPQVASNGDRTSHYLTWDLQSSEDFSKRKDNFWNDFQERRLVFPLQVTVSYRERDVNGEYGPTKTQTSCYDVSYFVDIPLETEKLIPDWLANDFVNATSWTIEKIDAVIPYLEKAILVTGVGCVASFLSKIVVRIMRLTVSKTEGTASGSCPAFGEGQDKLYLESTLKGWEDGNVAAADEKVRAILSEDRKEISLNEKCPATANMWNLEAGIEKAYRWTCDRVFCHASPARWTETKEIAEIKDVITSQQMCGVSGACVPLERVEQCSEYVEDTRSDLRISGDLSALDAELSKGGGVCWLGNDEAEVIGTAVSQSLYYYPGTEGEVNPESGIFKLKRVGSVLGDLGSSGDTLLVYQEPGTDSYCAARDQTCKQVCSNSRKAGFGPADDGYTISTPGGEAVAGNGACYQVTEEGTLVGASASVKVDEDKYAAGYTRDCFVGQSGGDTQFYQCVCEKAVDADPTKFAGARDAVARDDSKNVLEQYSYRQDKIFQERTGRLGTYYPPSRYIAGRDFSAAFGLDYLPDYLNGPDGKKVTQVNPNTQHIGAFQTMCLSGIRARLVLVRNILEGLRTCIVEAKYTGFQDAGMCKTIFAQHMCGLLYKAITYFGNQCSPININDVGREGALFGGVVKDFSSSIEPAIQGTLNDLQSDYGNAALNQYFAGGAQGFAQSICLAAFGFDWPLGFDFIQDAAYSVAMKTSVLVAPAGREFSSYDPKSLTALYNYNTAAVVFAGCKINSYQVSLKCIGPEDQGHPGIDTSCNGQGCDCLQATENSPFENEKKHLLQGGFNIQSGEMFDIPIQMPQKINSHYRYDHVMVELQLDANEDPARCFEEGYRTSTGGVFFQPIRDNSPPAVASCQVQLDGTYSCPELSDLFYGEEGLSYIDAPYIQCLDKRSGLYVDCETPNIFVEGDDISFKPYLYTDGKGYCLEVDVSGSAIDYGGPDGKEILTIPKGATGLVAPSISLGKVSSEMFGEFDTSIDLDEAESNVGCRELTVVDSPSTVRSNREISFDYVYTGSGFSLDVPRGVTVEDSGYTLTGSDDGGRLKKSSGVESFTREEINAVQFSYEGFTFNGVLGNAEERTSTNQCVYNVRRASRKNSRGESNIGVDITLMHTDINGQCHSASTPVTQTGLGKISHSERILILQDEIDVPAGSESDIYEYFVAEDYGNVITEASKMIEAFEGSLSEALGIYYYVAALIMQSDGDISDSKLKTRATTLMNRFFLRKDADGSSLALTYDEVVIETKEFQKVRVYLCEVAETIGIKDLYPKSDASDPSSTGVEYGCS